MGSIDLDPDLKHHIDLNETQHGPDLAKPKTLHIVKINDWFTMNNDNIDIEWRRLNMINLEYDHDNDLEIDSDITTFEWNRLNMVSFDTLDPHLNLIPEQHNEALRKIDRMRINSIDSWLIPINK